MRPEQTLPCPRIFLQNSYAPGMWLHSWPTCRILQKVGSAVLEVFNAVGASISVVAVPLSAIAPLGAGQIPAVCSLSRETYWKVP